MARWEHPPSRRRSRPEGVVPAVFHGSPYRWDVQSRHPTRSRNSFRPNPPPIWPEGDRQDDLRRHPPRVRRARVPPNLSPPFPHLYGAVGTVMMPMEGAQSEQHRPACPAAGGGGGPAPRAADPVPRGAAHLPRLLSSGTSIRQGACPSMCDSRATVGTMEQRRSGFPSTKARPGPGPRP